MHPIFIITLDKSTDRQKFMANQFNQLPTLKYEFFYGVNGKEDPNYLLFSRYNDAKRLLYKGASMTLGQLGCFASHYLLWQKCIELNQPIIVMEDDAILLDNFSSTIDFLNSLENNYEFLWLCCSYNPSKSKLINSHTNFNLEVHRYFKGWSNTAAYYLTPKSAQKLLDYCHEWVFNLDISMDRYWENNVPFYAVTPYCAKQQKEFASDISLNKTKRCLMVKMRKEFYALKDRINQKIFDLTK